MNGTERRDLLEKLGSFSTGELTFEEARRVEKIIREDPEALRLTGRFLRMLALLDTEEVDEEVEGEDGA